MNFFKTLAARVKSFFVRLFAGAPAEPGRFEQGTRWSRKGFVAVAPWVLPKRHYLVYVPRGHRKSSRSPLIVLIHGCKQTAEEIAQGSRITTLADEVGCLVLLPRQNPRANVWGCWNWFEGRTATGRGEAAIVAAQVRAVRRQYRVDRKRVFVAGISSGGALAAALVLRHSPLFSGVFVHSGVAAGATSSALKAIDVIKHGPNRDVAKFAASQRDRSGRHARVVPALVLHGARDDAVPPVHAEELVRQFLAFDRYPDVASAPEPLPPPTAVEERETAPGRTMTVREWRAGGRLVVREIVVHELGHAWSGGDATLPYNDPQPPEATALLRSFMHEVHSERGTPWRLPASATSPS